MYFLFGYVVFCHCHVDRFLKSDNIDVDFVVVVVVVCIVCDRYDEIADVIVPRPKTIQIRTSSDILILYTFQVISRKLQSLFVTVAHL